MSDYPPNIVVTSYKWEVRVGKRFRKRTVRPDPYCPEDRIYWLTSNDEFLVLDPTTGDIWQQGRDDDGWPTLMCYKVRTVKGLKL